MLLCKKIIVKGVKKNTECNRLIEDDKNSSGTLDGKQSLSSLCKYHNDLFKKIPVCKYVESSVEISECGKFYKSVLGIIEL
jgi:hypothetical protein